MYAIRSYYVPAVAEVVEAVGPQVVGKSSNSVGIRMKSVHELFTPEEKQKIKDTVAAAEQLTCGEIVPVIEDASYDYPRVV